MKQTIPICPVIEQAILLDVFLVKSIFTFSALNFHLQRHKKILKIFEFTSSNHYMLF